jgi:hypothetical protein
MTHVIVVSLLAKRIPATTEAAVRTNCTPTVAAASHGALAARAVRHVSNLTARHIDRLPHKAIGKNARLGSVHHAVLARHFHDVLPSGNNQDS